MSFRILIYCILPIITWFTCVRCTNMLEYTIKHSWDGDEITHDPIVLKLSGLGNEGIKLDISAPFFNDSDVPPGKPGESVWKLWDYEVVEAFFLGDNDNYVEMEFSPYGVHIILLLKGARNAVNFCLPVKFTSTILNGKWSGSAEIPAKYFPTNVHKFNAYAIHGKDSTRTYLSLYPVPKGKYDSPDFHRLEYFQDISFSEILPDNKNASLDEIWSVVRDPEKGCS